MLFVWSSTSPGMRERLRCPGSHHRVTEPHPRRRRRRTPGGRPPGRYGPPVTRSRYDVVVVGGGHNGLVAAAYLARAGRSVLVLERLAQVGRRRGQPAGVRRRRRPAVRVLLPGQPAARPDRRPTSASTSGWPTAPSPPTRRPCATAGPTGLLVERDEGPATATSFRAAHRLRRRVRRLAALLRPAGHAGRGPRPHPHRAAALRRRAGRRGCATPSSGTTCASARWPTWSPTTSPTTSSAASP